MPKLTKATGYLLCGLLYLLGLLCVPLLPGNWKLIGMVPVVFAAGLFRVLYR